MRFYRGPLAVALIVPCLAFSQKLPLTQDTYDSWRQLQAPALSNDGTWAVYTNSPVVGDGEVVFRATAGATEYRTPRGWTGRPVNTVASGGGFTANPARFSADSRFGVYLIYPTKQVLEEALRKKVPPAQQPKGSLGITNLSNGQVTTVDRVRSFMLPPAAGRYVFYQLEGDTPPRDSSARRDTTQAGRVAARRTFGTPLVIRELATGSETRIEDVASFVVDDSARTLAYVVATRAAGGDGAFLRDLASGRTTTLLEGEGEYAQLAIDRAGRNVAFVSNMSEFSQMKPRYTLYHATTGGGAAADLVKPGALGVLHPSANGDVLFTRDGSAITFGVAPTPEDSIPADSLADKAVFDLWHYQDRKLQPQQRVEAGRDRNRTFLSIVPLRTKRAVVLANDTMPNVTVSDDGRIALTVTNVPYAVEAMWGDGGNDVFVTDIGSGRITPVARRLESFASLSPGAKYVLYFHEKQWHSFNVATGQTVNLTSGLQGVRFDQETHDSPSTAPSWGTAAWTTDDRSVLIYDRYDIWEMDPLGARPPRMVTDSAGVRAQVTYRLIDLDREDRFIQPTQPLLLRAFNNVTKASGYSEDRLDRTMPPRQIVYGDRNYGNPTKARNADRYLATQQTVAEFPDLWTGTSLENLTKITNANPQQSEYLWPTVDLIDWISGDGVKLQGMLYKPENFDPSKQWPMVVYFYETLSDGLHNYHAPTGRNVINPSVYTSLGYVVFFPDIVYENGWPGPSSMKAIVPGVQSILARGYVNPKAVGIAGQSWGGYQSAYLITQTNMFAAAVPNAPVANMTSAYGGIRWESGMARAFQYEKTQSRIGGSLWEAPVRYIENSPLFHLDRVTTPVLFMHNDGDGAVPWYQGIELFVGLRRLGKEAYMVNYNGDAHNPRKRANQMDIDRRMQQFFANKLKGEQAPDWMKNGIPFLDKGKDQLRTIVP